MDTGRCGIQNEDTMHMGWTRGADAATAAHEQQHQRLSRDKYHREHQRQARPRLGPRQGLQKARSEEVLPPEAGPPPPRAPPDATAGGGADLASFPARASSRSSGTSATGGASRQRPRQGHQSLTLLARGRVFLQRQGPHHSLHHSLRQQGPTHQPPKLQGRLAALELPKKLAGHRKSTAARGRRAPASGRARGSGWRRRSQA